jgi:hypothetical protein
LASCVWTLLRVAFFFWARPRKTGDTGCRVGKEVLLMRDDKPQRHNSEERSPWGSPCQINHLFDGASCVEAAQEEVDGLLLCDRHALEAKLEGQISCWDEMLFHIDLWSREAARRDREDVVELLDVQRAQATTARHRACDDLDVLRRETPCKRRGPPTRRRGSLLLLPPPRASRPLSGGLRGPRRR